MVEAYLSLGSNIGDRKTYLNKAVQRLAQHPQIQVVRESSLYETSPVGGVPQDDYINQAVLIETTLASNELLAYIHQLEAAADRTRDVRWGPRTLDIDILLFGDEESDDDELTLPHPRMFERLFVLEPMREIMNPSANKYAAVSEAMDVLKQSSDQEIVKVGEENDQD